LYALLPMTSASRRSAACATATENTANASARPQQISKALVMRFVGKLFSNTGHQPTYNNSMGTGSYRAPARLQPGHGEPHASAATGDRALEVLLTGEFIDAFSAKRTPRWKGK